MTSVLIIQPDDSDPPERLGAWLESEGLELVVIRPHIGETVPVALDHDALIVLGGDMGANDDADHPWLIDIKALLHDTVVAGEPTLGVCLGAQLLASALGGVVERGQAGIESGTVVVRARADAGGDALLGGLSGSVRMMTMHRDAITVLPPEAIWLADSDPYPHQAFRVGESAWGVQFHPEISTATYRKWADHSTDTGKALQAVINGIEEVERHDVEIVRGAEALARAFARVVKTRIDHQCGPS